MPKPRCNQCDSLHINGVYCHETGCPNTHKEWDEDEMQWVTPEPEMEEDNWDWTNEDDMDDEEEDYNDIEDEMENRFGDTN